MLQCSPEFIDSHLNNSQSVDAGGSGGGSSRNILNTLNDRLKGGLLSRSVKGLRKKKLVFGQLFGGATNQKEMRKNNLLSM